jgi:DNA-binding transcriptional MerR regulator
MPTPNPQGTLTLADLARLADVTPRTVRFYVAQGLLPSPGQSGPGARYLESTLPRLRLIREMQRNHLPLAEIRTRLAGVTDDEIAGLVAPVAPPPSDTAIDYIRGLLGTARLPQPLPQPLNQPVPPAGAAPAMASGGMQAAEPAPLPARAPSAMHPAVTAAPFDGPPEMVERSQWDRIALTPDIELQIRRPLGRLEQRRVERLITIARQVLKEDTP